MTDKTLTSEGVGSGFQIGFTLDDKLANPGPSVDFVVTTMKLLGRKHGNRMLEQAIFNSWLPLLGKIEAEYKRLGKPPKRRREGSKP